MSETVKYMSFQPLLNKFTVRLPEYRDRDCTGRQYIKQYMRKASVGWPHDHIDIQQDIWDCNCWTVQFGRKAAEHAVMFRMILE
jgi:hypothetical protein